MSVRGPLGRWTRQLRAVGLVIFCVIVALILEKAFLLIGQNERLRRSIAQLERLNIADQSRDVQKSELLSPELYVNLSARLTDVKPKPLVLVFVSETNCRACPAAWQMWAPLMRQVRSQAAANVWHVTIDGRDVQSVASPRLSFEPVDVAADVAEPSLFAARTGITVVPFAALVSTEGRQVLCVAVGVPSKEVVEDWTSAVFNPSRVAGSAFKRFSWRPGIESVRTHRDSGS